MAIFGLQTFTVVVASLLACALVDRSKQGVDFTTLANSQVLITDFSQVVASLLACALKGVYQHAEVRIWVQTTRIRDLVLVLVFNLVLGSSMGLRINLLPHSYVASLYIDTSNP